LLRRRRGGSGRGRKHRRRLPRARAHPAPSVEAVSLSGLSRSLTVNLMVLASAVAVAATIIGLVTFWPHGSVARPRSITTQKTLGATVVYVFRTRCSIAGAAGRRTARESLPES